MAIFKAKVESNFSTIPNAALQDKSLSFEATGLLAMMLSLPDDWEIHKSWLQKQKIKCGRDKLTKIMGELIDAGYVIKLVRQNEDGKLDGVDWLVYPTVQLENRTTENPSNGKQDTTKETDTQKKQYTNNMAQPGVEPSVKNKYPEEFEWIWSNKPIREGANPKKQAYQACNARIREGNTWRELAAGLMRYVRYCEQTGILNTRLVQQMSTFFGTKESFKESWVINHETNARTQNRRLTAEEEANQRLFEQYGDPAARNQRTTGSTANHGVGEHQVSGSFRESVGAKGVTIDMEAGIIDTDPGTD